MGLPTLHSRWRSNSTSGYRSLDDLYAEKETVPWYWRFIAQIAVWMILGGYLILPNTFDSNSKLRFGNGILAILIVALLTGGYSLTALLWFACPPILFRLDNIFIPTFASSVFAFLATLYAFASSTRYSFAEAMGPTTLGMTAASSIIYGVLALATQRKVRRISVQRQNSMSLQRSFAGTPTSGSWQEPNYYQNFVQNMHPTAARSHYSFDAPTIHTPVSEEDMVNQQMALLLQKKDPVPSPDASQTTFRLEWPQGEAEEDIDPSGRRRMRTFSASSGLLSPPGRGYRSRSESVQDGRSSAWAKIGRVVGVDRGRPDSRDGPSAGPSSGHARAKSRDERRREIELGQL